MFTARFCSVHYPTLLEVPLFCSLHSKNDATTLEGRQNIHTKAGECSLKELSVGSVTVRSNGGRSLSTLLSTYLNSI